jgi:pyruvate kinase
MAKGRDMKRSAKIVCTIGPASAGRGVLRSLVGAGMDVARLNFSHGDHQSHKKIFDSVRALAKKAGRPVAVLQDLQGIKIRTGEVEGGAMTLRRGREVTIRAGAGKCAGDTITINYRGLIKDAKRGDRILLDDGYMELKVTGKGKGALRARVIEGGVLTSHKGVNLPGVKISAESFTRKDREDLAFGLKVGVDYVAVSFVREARDIVKVKNFIKRAGKSVPVIAKIEKPEAIENIGAILDEADGIMVARGDLGVEVPTEEVPLLQKMLIERANRRGRLVITATQMLESMTAHMRPTRAEVTDVANAVIDGTDALMLSEETSAGKYPLRSLQIMDRIIRETEGARDIVRSYQARGTYSEAVAEAAVEAASDIGARYIVAFTHSGYTARLLSKHRPRVPVIAFTPFEEVMRRMSLYRGVVPMRMGLLKSTDRVFNMVERILLTKKLARRGQSVVITASTPIGGEGKTNVMKLHRLGE